VSDIGGQENPNGFLSMETFSSCVNAELQMIKKMMAID